MRVNKFFYRLKYMSNAFLNNKEFLKTYVYVCVRHYKSIIFTIFCKIIVFLLQNHKA